MDPLLRATALLGAPVVAAGGLVVGCSWWVRRQARGRVVSAEEAPAAPTALVLGAGLRRDGTPDRFLSARLDVGRDLYARGVVADLLVSGDGRSPAHDETAAMRDYLVAHGVPAAAIRCDPLGVDTYQSCARAVSVFGVRRLLLVSQAYHLPRAVALARAVGLDAVGVGDVSRRRSRRTWWTGWAREWPANVKAERVKISV